ncbi:MAG: AAA family ATPase [Deinococcales bacterium]
MKRQHLRISYKGKSYNLSQGALLEHLQYLGIDTDLALRIAKQAEKDFSNKKFSSNDLEGFLLKALKQQLNDELLERISHYLPSFIPIYLLADESQNKTNEKANAEPEEFSRRHLARALERHDINFKDSQMIARQVEESLRAKGLEAVSRQELERFILQQIESYLGRERRLSYEKAHPHGQELLIEDSQGQTFPFSQGILARSLVAIGLDIAMAYQIAREVETQLWQLGYLHKSDQVSKITTELLNEHGGKDFSLRYTMMRRLRHSRKPLIILLGGTSGVGKSTLASELAYRLGIGRIVSTDALRQALRSLISAELSPILHSSSFAAWRTELLPGESEKVKAKRVLRAFQTQVQQVAKALDAVIERARDEGMSMLMEGVHVVPGFLNLSPLRGAVVVAIIISQSDEIRHQNNFRKRSSDSRKANDYLEHFQEIRILQDFITQQAKNKDIPVIDFNDLDSALEKALDIILAEVLEA